MFITSFGEQNITYKCCSNFLIHLLVNERENLIDSFLKAVQYSIQYTQMQLSSTFLLYDVSPLSGNPESKIKLEAVEHGHKVLKHLTEA